MFRVVAAEHFRRQHRAAARQGGGEAAFGHEAVELWRGLAAGLRDGIDQRQQIFPRDRLVQGDADAARRFLQDEGIPLIASDLCGTQARRIRFWPVIGRVQLHLLGEARAPVREQPMPQRGGDVELF